MTAERVREGWVDDVKGLACFLVATGHGFQGLVFTEIMDAGGLWHWFNGAIYCFHVQLFFLCSGYLWQRFGRGAHWKAVAGKAWVLGVPYVAFTTLSWALKTAFEPWVNHKAGILWRNLFVDPVAPYWYLAALAFLFALLPRVRRLRTWAWVFGAAVALKALAASLGCQTWPFAVRTVAANAFWFAGGMGLALWGTDWLHGRAAKWAGTGCGALFLAGSAAAATGGGFGNAWLVWGLGAVACMAALTWAANRERKPGWDFWNWTGRNALPIFLLHTFCTAPVRMCLCAIGTESLWAHIPAMLAAGLFGPVAILRVMELTRLDGLLDPRRWGFRRRNRACASTTREGGT